MDIHLCVQVCIGEKAVDLSALGSAVITFLVVVTNASQAWA
ncbi:hypothetical protein [Photorhabdus luminescens]|nr:hypothetical protein [Photorhabdus luminescens]